MSQAKSDRSIAPAGGNRPSRAKGSTRDRNITPPATKAKKGTKPKKGERTMEAALAKDAAPVVATVVKPEVLSVVVADDAPPPPDPWWTAERERTYQLTLQGIPQHQIADALERDRHTVARWQEEERFVERLREENEHRFHAMRQRRTIQTVRLTDKAHTLAVKMMEMAEEDPKDLNSRLAARDWLSEFREQSRREDEIYGLDRQHVDVNVRGSVQHNHKGKVDVSFKEFVLGALRRSGIDPEAEDVDPERAAEALSAAAEHALMEGTFLDDLVEREKAEHLMTPPTTR